jgi:parvulin-like peptidyl-prolyl isomerase
MSQNEDREVRPRSAQSLRKKGFKLRPGLVLAGILVIAACVVIRHYWGAEPVSADPRETVPEQAAPAPQRSARPARGEGTMVAQPTAGKIVATVNSEPVTREDLASECLRHYGKEVLEGAMNKYLIAQECKRRNVVITQGDVDDEIRRMATRFGLPLDQWLKMLKQERGINPAQYASDIIWPTLALRRLAGKQLTVSPQELTEEFERQYGPAVKVRIIVCKDRQSAESVRAAAAAKPDDFENLAKAHSVDPNSASLKGLIPPIRKHVGDEKIEQIAFQMKDGQISEAIPVANQFIILKRESLLPPSSMTFEQAQGRLEEILRDRKMRRVAQEIFNQLQSGSVVRNVYNDPALRTQMPGIAATINGYQVSVAELQGLCLERHGEEVLEGTINRRLIEQACKKAGVAVNDAELDAEIARAALVSVKPKPDGSPDVETWLKLVTQQQGVSEEVYRRDAVWPSVALKKLVGDSVKILEEDVQKGFEANYGPRVRCRAIVLNSLRRAQQVWEMARDVPKGRQPADHFGDLAEKYSIEAGSQALRGQVPPIQRYGGQPLLEKDAFTLQPGEISGIIDVGGSRYVIMFCEGRTEPVKVDFAAVRNLIYEDIHEKKLRAAMANYFEKLQENATIDNYLAGTTRSPTKKADQVNPASHVAPREAREGSVLRK